MTEMNWRAVWVPEGGHEVEDSAGDVRVVDEPGWHVVSDGDGPHGYPVVLRLDGVGHEGDPSVAEWVVGLLSAATGGGVRLLDLLEPWPQSRQLFVGHAALALGVGDPYGAYGRGEQGRMRVVLTR